MSQPEAGPSSASFDSQGSMPMDITTGSIDVPSQPSSTPEAQPTSSSSAGPEAQPAAPSTTVDVPRPIAEPPTDPDRRQTVFHQALYAAACKGVNKFTWEDFKASIPLQAQVNPDECLKVFVQLGEQLRERIVAVGKEVHFAANGTEGLRAVQQAVEKAKEREQQGDTSLRGDEWIFTPNLSPAAISATFNLPLYDSEHARLTAELQELDASILTAATGLQQLESERTSVEAITTRQLAEIGETVAALEKLPTDDMTHWMERVLAEGGR